MIQVKDQPLISSLSLLYRNNHKHLHTCFMLLLLIHISQTIHIVLCFKIIYQCYQLAFSQISVFCHSVALPGDIQFNDVSGCIVFHCLFNHSFTENQQGFSSLSHIALKVGLIVNVKEFLQGNTLKQNHWVTGSAYFIGEFNPTLIFSMSFFYIQAFFICFYFF